MTRRRRNLWMTGLLIWGLLALGSRTSAWRGLEFMEFDVLTLLSTPGHIDLPIIIVGIDEPSFGDLARQWPWPRQYHARLVDALHQGGAGVIAFDILFAEASTQTDDQAFANTITRAGNVVLAGDLVLQQREQFEMLMRVDPFPLLLDAGGRTGISSITLDTDRVVRKIPGFDDAFWQVVIDVYQEQTGSRITPKMPDPARSRVRYLGPDHSFTYVSYYQALDPEKNLPPEIFKDKIVLVGFDAKVSAQPGMSQADSFAGAFSRWTGRMTPGAEIQASFIANALLGCHIRMAPPFSALIMTALTLLVSLAGMASWRPVQSFLILLAVWVALFLVGAGVFRYFDFWLPVGTAGLGALLLFLGRGAAAWIHERKQRMAIRNAFAHYVAPQVVDQMIRHPEQLKLGGARRYITLMFTDLEGFTSISEHMSPEKVGRFLNDYFTQMSRIILSSGGTIDKFIGDAIMAFWGAPLDDPNQAVNAVKAAIDMQQAMNRDDRPDCSSRDGLPKISMRIGIHSGEAIVGNMGSVDRFDYSALGDSVNLASRLEGVNRLYGSKILISETTAKQVKNAVSLMYVDRVIVKGKTTPIDIYTPVEDAETVRAAAAAARAYHRQHWAEARQLWQSLVHHPVAGPIARIYLDRIDGYQVYPPPADWDGAIVLKTK